MDIFTELRAVATRLDTEGEFPTWLMTDIIAIADRPERYAHKIHVVELLVTQIDNFDAYAGAGCFDNSVSAETIGATIRRIMANDAETDDKPDTSCSLMPCCQFFNDHMKEMPMSAELVKDKLCRGNYEACNRYKIYKEFGAKSIPPHLNPDDTDQVNKILSCLRKKKCEGD